MAYSGEVLRYNSYGKEYEVPRRRVLYLSELQRGDHIAFHRGKGIYWHHAIVKHINAISGEIKTIEYNRNGIRFKVLEKTILFQNVTVYLMLHGSFDRDLVLWRAQSKIGDEEYNLVTNNCEHFAMWCITGRSSCDQVDKGLEMVNKEVGQRLIGSKVAPRVAAKLAAQSASHTGRTIMSGEVGRLLVSKGAGMTGKLAAQSASHTGRVIVTTGMTQSVAQNGLTTKMASDVGAGVGGTLAGGALAAAFEGLSMAYDIGKVRGDLATGRIDQKGYYKTVGKRVMTGASGVAASTFGMAAGQALIPIPGVGAFIGGVAGALAGRFVGNLTGNIVYDDDCEDDVDYYEANDTYEISEEDLDGDGADYHYYEADDTYEISEEDLEGHGADYYYYYADDTDDDTDEDSGYGNYTYYR